MYAFCNTRIAVPALEVDAVLSGRTAYANLCICGRCLFGEGSNAFDRSLLYAKSGLNCYTAVDYQHSVSLVSCVIRVLSESICISYNIHVELALVICRSFRIVL